MFTFPPPVKSPRANLLRTLLERRYTVAVPLMVGAGQMIARQIHSLDELRLGPRGILEPAVGEPLHGLIDVCVCPGWRFPNIATASAGAPAITTASSPPSHTCWPWAWPSNAKWFRNCPANRTTTTWTWSSPKSV